MDTIVCEHAETMEEVPGLGLTIAKCSLCGQIRKFKDGEKESEVLVKLGRIDGKLVMPKVGVPLPQLTPEETRLVREGYDNQRAKGQQEKPQKKAVVIKVRSFDGTSYDQHRDEILADRLSLGQRATLDKWGITDGTWVNIKRYWRSLGIVVRNLDKGYSLSLRKRQEAREEAPAEPIEVTPETLHEIIPENEIEEPTMTEPEEFVVPEPRDPSTTTLPPFPDFDSRWPMLTQIEWIKAYKDMVLALNK